MAEKTPYEYSDEELIEGALKKDRHFQEMLYRKYADGMYTVACSYSETEAEAADILQDGFIKVFRKLHTHDKTKSLGGWIRRVVVNTALEAYRKKKRHLEVVEDFSHNVDESYEIFSGLQAADIIKYVNQLPLKAQMVLKLYSIEGYKHQEIAEQLDISVGTSKSQLNRAKSLLKSMIDPQILKND